MEKSEQARGGRHPSGGKPTKEDQIKASGLSKSAAHGLIRLDGKLLVRDNAKRSIKALVPSKNLLSQCA